MNSPNLSESTFADMEEKIKSLMNERSRRENELVRKKETLLSLWNALQTPLDDLDRNILTRLLEGPARLQRKTFEKADHEIQRQEKTKSRILKDLIQKKIEEIQMICGNGHLPIPNEVAALRHSELNEDRPGHFADTLTRLTRIQTEMTLLSERRSEILKEIHELESARSEIDWLNSYEHDGDRYKGRDCNKKLRRAIKAGKLREKMPALVEKLHLAISDWERSEQRPFVFDGVDYRTHVLERFELHAPLSARSGRKTPAGRRSAFPSYSPPIQSARGLSKQKTKPATFCIEIGLLHRRPFHDSTASNKCGLQSITRSPRIFQKRSDGLSPTPGEAGSITWCRNVLRWIPKRFHFNSFVSK